MTGISNEQISIEEAKAALRCMRLGGLSPEESIETLESLTQRIRKVSTSKIVENIIENQLSDVQQKFIKEYWYSGKNTACIARENGVSQANVYNILTRANETIRKLMTPIVQYHNDLIETDVVPLYVESLMEICAARNSDTQRLCKKLENLRVSSAISHEQLASLLKITKRELKDIESGNKNPSIETLMRYSSAFGVEITIDFVNGRGNFECKTA